MISPLELHLFPPHLSVTNSSSNPTPSVRCRVHSQLSKTFFVPHFVHRKHPTSTAALGSGLLGCPSTPQLSPGTWAGAEDAEMH